MLRKLVLALGLLSLAGAALLGLKGVYAPAAWLGVNGVVLIVSVLYERIVYKKIEAAAPDPGWRATGERFVDPASGELVEVYFDAAQGERHYVKVTGGNNVA